MKGRGLFLYSHRGDRMTEPILPKLPNHAISRAARKVADAIDKAAKRVGILPYRVFFFTEVRAGPRKGEGDLVSSPTWDEIRPPPRLRSISTPRDATEAGAKLSGSIRLTHIDRTRYRREQLKGQTLLGDPLGPDRRFFYAVLPEGQGTAELYNPGSDPILGRIGWEIRLTPVNRRVPWTGGAALTARERGIELP